MHCHQKMSRKTMHHTPPVVKCNWLCRTDDHGDFQNSIWLITSRCSLTQHLPLASGRWDESKVKSQAKAGGAEREREKAFPSAMGEPLRPGSHVVVAPLRLEPITSGSYGDRETRASAAAANEGARAAGGELLLFGQKTAIE